MLHSADQPIDPTEQLLLHPIFKKDLLPLSACPVLVVCGILLFSAPNTEKIEY